MSALISVFADDDHFLDSTRNMLSAKVCSQLIGR
jgi:hypothetical protein